VTTLPLTAGLDARALLGRVQASYDQTADDRPVELPAGAPPLPAGLVERIAQARFLAGELRPLVDLVCATYAEAATLVGSSFGPSVAEDKPCEDFSRAIGCSQLGATLDDLSDQLGAAGWPQ
jgi:hypothetical protein